MSSTSHDSPYAWLRLAITLAAGVVINAGMWLIIIIMPAVEAEFGATRAEVSLPFTMSMIGFALGNFAVGAAVDRYGAARVLALAAIGAAATFWLSTLSQSVYVLALLQVAAGFTAAAGFGPLIADISHWFLRRRGLAVAIVASGNYLSGAIWTMALTGLLEAQGWRAVFEFMAVATFLTVVPLSFALRRTVPQETRAIAENEARSRAMSIGLSPRALAILLGCAGIGCCVAMSMPQVHIVAYCVDLGYGPAAGAEMLSLMLMGGVVSRLISGVLADKLGGIRTVLIGSVLQCLALVAYLPSDALVSLYVVSMVFGLSQGGIVPGYAVIVREFMPAHDAGRRIGFVLMATIMGMALGGWLSGLIYDATGRYFFAFWNGIAWNALNIAILLWLLNRSRADRTLVPAT